MYWGSLAFLIAMGTFQSAWATVPFDQWVWAGIPTRQISSKAQQLYIHQGVCRMRGPRAVFEFQGLSAHALKGHPIVLVLRLETLASPESWMESLRALVIQWQAYGNDVRGIQLDFDSPTARLPQYAHWLSEVRHRLPNSLKLSVTGLADWSTQGSPRDLDQLAGVTDEIVFQLYRGRQPIQNQAVYLRGLARLSIPFKLGLLPSMEIKDSIYREVRANRMFKGVVVFLGRKAT